MIFDLEIDTLAFGGSGLGRRDGKAIFVPLTAPGDAIRCRVVRDRKTYAEGECEELLRGSPLRRDPPCPVFGRCGGCHWQHLPYAQQSLWKERIFADLLVRHAGVAPERVLPLVPSPEEWGYRSRVQFKCRQTAEGFVMGFYRRGSHFVVDVARCPIAEERINDVLALFLAWLSASPCPDRIPQVDMDMGDDGRVRVIVHFIGEDPAPLTRYLGPLTQEAGLSLFLQQGRKQTLTPVCGVEDLVLSVGQPPLALAYGPGGFAQVNRAQNRALVREVTAAAGLTGRETVLDLFCGMGNFSLPLAAVAGQVIGIEDFAPSIEKARVNARANRIGNAAFHAAPAECFPELCKGPIDLVVLDPPRSGAHDVVRKLCASEAPRILYVSCEPTTLARDLRPLLHGGYTHRWSRPFDLFPQTYHIESLTLLEKH